MSTQLEKDLKAAIAGVSDDPDAVELQTGLCRYYQGFFDLGLARYFADKTIDDAVKRVIEVINDRDNGQGAAARAIEGIR